MREMRLWHLAVFALAIVAIVAGAWWAFSGERIRLASSVPMVDVGTGEIFELRIGPGGATVPGMNPKTRTLSLLPVEERQPGRWFIAERYLSALADMECDKSAVVDARSGEVRLRER